VKTIALVSMKGGVGKTTAAVNLAYQAQAQGLRTLLWDLDPQGAASYALRVKPKLKGGTAALIGRGQPVTRFLKGSDYPDLDLLPADFSARHIDLVLDGVKRRSGRIAKLLDEVCDDYDIVLIDCPPGGGLSIEGAIEAADLVLSPTVPTPFAVRTVSQTRRLVNGHAEFRTFLSMVDGRKRLHRDVRETLRGTSRALLDAEIPNTTMVERMSERRAPVGSFAPRSAAAAAFDALWREVDTNGFGAA
jgi:chromosome partitioning protein